MSRVTVTWQDHYTRVGLFSFLIDDTYDDGVYAELLAFVQDLLDASAAKVTKVQVARELSIAGLTGNTTSDAGSYSAIGDQAVVALRSATGVDTKITIPAPLDAVFDAAGAFEGANVDLTDALLVALIATGETEPLLVNQFGEALSFRKGWRKGQKHS